MNFLQNYFESKLQSPSNGSMALIFSRPLVYNTGTNHRMQEDISENGFLASDCE